MAKGGPLFLLPVEIRRKFQAFLYFACFIAKVENVYVQVCRAPCAREFCCPGKSDAVIFYTEDLVKGIRATAGEAENV